MVKQNSNSIFQNDSKRNPKEAENIKDIVYDLDWILFFQTI